MSAVTFRTPQFIVSGISDAFFQPPEAGMNASNQNPIGIVNMSLEMGDGVNQGRIPDSNRGAEMKNFTTK